MNNATNSVPQETINGILIDMLRGAKDAGSEIYTASRTGIVKAVDFAQEQTPLVIQEFLAWRMSQAIIYLVVGVIALVFVGYLVKKCFSKQWVSYSDGASVVAACLVGGTVFSSVLFAVVVPSVETIVKVKVAPRVYVIEWVSDQISNKNEHDQRRMR